MSLGLPHLSTEEQGLRGNPFRVLDFTQHPGASGLSGLPRLPNLPGLSGLRGLPSLAGAGPLDAEPRAQFAERVDDASRSWEAALRDSVDEAQAATSGEELGLGNLLGRPLQELLEAVGLQAGDGEIGNAFPQTLQRAVSEMVLPLFNLAALKKVLGADSGAAAEEDSSSLAEGEGDVEQSGQLDIEVEIEHTGSGASS